MKRIVFFLSSLEEGGAQRVVSILSNKLVEKDFDVTVLMYFNEEINYKINEKVKLVSVIKETGITSKFKNIKWIRDFFNKNADVVISFLAPFNMLTLFANPNVPVIVADRNDPYRVPSNTIIRKIRDLIYKKANKVVLQTTRNKEYFNYINDKCVVINNPIDIDAKRGIALTFKKENKVVSVGRLMEQKNQLLLIDAFNEIKDEFNNYQLVIYGDGPYRRTLENRIKELNLNNKVILYGNSKKILDDIKDAKLFVLSSNYEGMPNALIEAMCLGLPVISTNVSGASDIVVDGENGYLIDVNNKEQLIDKMRKILSDSILQERLGKEAVKLNDLLNVDVIVNKWITIINEVMK